MDKYFRPVWTSGRYDAPTHSAIYYNLITGYSYFFENKSADVVGCILQVKRNKIVDVETIATKVEISASSIVTFFRQLEGLNLLTPYSCIEDLVNKERTRVRLQRQNEEVQKMSFAKDGDTTDAERDYQNRVRPKVFNMLFELTYNCSEKCIHCYNPGAIRADDEKSTRHDRKELTFDEYKDVIDQLYDCGLVRVCLSGGDPFAKPIVWDIIKYLYDKDIVFDIYTNGQQLLGKEILLANYFPCSVGLSIYSHINDVHDSITRMAGSYAKTMRALDTLHALGVPLQIKCCIMRQNCKSYRGVVKIAEKYRATLQLECNIFDSVDGDACVSRYLRLTPEELHIVLRDKDIPLYVGPEKENYGAKSFPSNENVCGAGYSGFCMTPDGKFTPCVSFQSCIGDVRQERVSDIINKPILQRWRRCTFSDYEECGTYDYCEFCALCPGLNFAANGNPVKACENNCYMAKVRKKLAELLKEGKDPLCGRSIDEAISQLPDVSVKDIKRTATKNFYLHKMMDETPSV